jgi:hypothetical protein
MNLSPLARLLLETIVAACLTAHSGSRAPSVCGLTTSYAGRLVGHRQEAWRLVKGR